MSINRPLAYITEEFDKDLVTQKSLLTAGKQRQVEKDPMPSPEQVNKV